MQKGDIVKIPEPSLFGGDVGFVQEVTPTEAIVNLGMGNVIEIPIEMVALPPIEEVA